MIVASDIYNLLDSKYPFRYAEEWDNVGLIAGRNDKEIKKIMLTLDVDENVVKESVETSCDLIVSHHPLMFRAIKSLNWSVPEQRTLMKLVASDTVLLSAHTNLDVSPDGLNDSLAQKIGLSNTNIMEITGEDRGIKYGFGRIGNLKNECSFKEFLSNIKNVLSLKGLRYTGDLNKTIKKVAVNCGGGADALHKAIALGADVFVSGDVKYNAFRDARDIDIAFVDAGHFETEIMAIDLFEKLLREAYPDIELVKSKENIPVINYYVE